MKTDLNTLLRILGTKDVEIDQLQVENRALRQQLAELAESIVKKKKDRR